MKRIIMLTRIGLKTLSKRNIPTILFSLVIILMTILPVILYGVSQSMLSSVAESKKDVYGEFSNIYYSQLENVVLKNPLSSEEILSYLPEMDYRSAGIFTTVAQINQQNCQLVLGYGDETALKLGRVKLLEGHFPQAKDEIVLAQSLFKSLAVSELGDSIELANHRLKVVGMVEDYGRLWVKGKPEVDNNIQTNNVLVFPDFAATLFQETNYFAFQVLIERDTEILIAEDGEQGLYRNANAQLEAQETVFTIPDIFIWILLISTIIILYNLLVLSKNRIVDRLQIYHYLGMKKNDLYLGIWVENIVSILCSVVVGLGIALASIQPILWALGRNTNQVFSFSVDLFGIIGIILMIILSSTMAVGIFMYHISRSLFTSSAKRKNQIRIKKNSWYLNFFEFIQSQVVLASLCLLIATAVTIAICSIFYQSSFKTAVEYNPDRGMMPMDYDFEFVTEPLLGRSVEGMEAVAFFTDSYEKDGATKLQIDAVTAEDGVSESFMFRENNKMDLLLPQGMLDDFIDGRDFYQDGHYLGMEAFIQDLDIVDYFKYTNIQIIDTKLVGYPENVLKDFEEYITAGGFNYDKLRSGEEVILVAPPYTLEEVEEIGEDGSTTHSALYDPYPEDLSTANHNTLLKLGDEITLSGLLSDKRFNGAVSVAEAKKYFERKDVHVKIGAIITTPIGWFDLEATASDVYRFLTLNEAFDSLGLNDTYNRFRIYTTPDSDAEAMSQKMALHQAQFPYMLLVDKQAELTNYKRLNSMVDIFTISLIALVMLLTTVSLTSQFLTKTKLNMKKYALLRINGLSINRLIQSWLIQLLCLFLVGMIISLPISIFLICGWFDIEFSLIFDIVPLGKVLFLIASLAALTGISIIPSIVLIKRRRQNFLQDM